MTYSFRPLVFSGMMALGILALGACEPGSGAPGGSTTPPPPPPPTPNACGWPDCLKLVKDESRSNATREWYNIVNECDAEWNVAYCVVPAGQGRPECGSPDTPALAPGEESGAIILSGQEATVQKCGCEVPQRLELSQTSPWDGTGTCVRPSR